MIKPGNIISYKNFIGNSILVVTISEDVNSNLIYIKGIYNDFENNQLMDLIIKKNNIKDWVVIK